MIKRVLLFVVALSLIVPASGREWFRPVHTGKAYVNCDLTPERAIKHARDEWDGQLVLWEGRIERQRRAGATTYLTLGTAAGPVAVTFPKKALTLDRDRTGFQVAVKGNLQVAGGRVQGLVGRSAILLGPPKPWSLPRSSEPLVGFLQWWAGFHNPHYPSQQLTEIAQAIADESRANGLDPLLLASLVQIESAYKVDAVSSSGALGLGQLMPFVADGLGVDARDPKQNVRGAARMLAGLVNKWGSSDNAYALALASYNAGPTLVGQLGAVPRIPETNNYVYFIGFVHERMKAAARAQGLSL